MKLRLFLLVTLFVVASLLIPSVPGHAAARTAPSPPAQPANPTAFSCDAVTEIPKTECAALVALYNATNGVSWKNRANWLATDFPCSWFGVQCGPGHVRVLLLADNGLGGQIPGELANLVNLERLSLESNQLRGTIPPELGLLSSLRGLYLDTNQLSGNIPAELAGLNNLINLRLYGNELGGTIPPDLSQMASLMYLNLSDNRLTGPIPAEIGDLVHLQYLYLDWNQLSGSLPPELGNLLDLLQLQLDHNQLTGQVPSQLGRLVKLQRLRLSYNHLSGPIPSELGSLIGLQGLELQANVLDGEIPHSIVNLTSLSPGQEDRLSLGYNKLSSSDPAVVAFVSEKDPYWAGTQTVAPGTVQAAVHSVSSVRISWTVIPYTNNGGYYEIGGATTLSGPYSTYGRTADKIAPCFAVNNLTPARTYYFAVRTYTPAHAANQNDLLSGWSQEVSATPGLPAYLPVVVR